MGVIMVNRYRQIVMILAFGTVVVGCNNSKSETSAQDSAIVSARETKILASKVKIDQEIKGGKIVALRDLRSTTSGEGLTLIFPSDMILATTGLPTPSGGAPLTLKVPSSSMMSDQVTSRSYAEVTLDKAVIIGSTLEIRNHVSGTSVDSGSTVLLQVEGTTASGEKVSAVRVPADAVEDSAEIARSKAEPSGRVLALKSFINGDWRRVFVPLKP